MGNQKQQINERTMAKKKKNKRTNNNLQNITQKTKDRARRTPLKISANVCRSKKGGYSSAKAPFK